MSTSQEMNVSVFGLGYVGCVSISCLADSGHSVIGVDVKDVKVNQVQNGIPTIYEPGLNELMKEAHSQGKISATTDVQHAINNSTVSLITVGTPSLPDGELDLSYIFAVAEQIGMALANVDHFHTVAVRSTVKPGTCNIIGDIIAEKSGKRKDIEFGVAANPEFLREGRAISDYRTPPYVLIGSDYRKAAEEVAKLYTNVDGEILSIGLASAEIIKYINNSWHAVKVAFGNEVGSVCKTLGIDSQEVMDVFVKDRQLNISPVYLRPGFAFGGSCLPKDLAGFTTLAGLQGVSVPMLENVTVSNEQHILRAVELIRSKKINKIGLLGLTFKEGTDDLRNSAAIKVVKVLMRQGYDIKVFDADVNSALNSGINLESTEHMLGEVKKVLANSFDELLAHSKTLVVAKNEKSYREFLAHNRDVSVIDLVHIGKPFTEAEGYTGLAW